MTVVYAQRVSWVLQKNLKIKNIKVKSSNTDYIYHAGTKTFNNEIRSNGGRVLNITSLEIII